MDHFTPNADGSVTLGWADREITLRRPLFGEYEALRRKGTELLTVERGEGETFTWADWRAAWWLTAIGMLRTTADGPLPEPSDLPLWIVSPPGDLRDPDDPLHAEDPKRRAEEHWRQVPLARGGQPTTAAAEPPIPPG